MIIYVANWRKNFILNFLNGIKFDENLDSASSRDIESCNKMQKIKGIIYILSGPIQFNGAKSQKILTNVEGLISPN